MANEVLWGFVQLADVFNENVNDVGIERVNRAIELTLEEHNRQLNALLNLFVERTEQFKTRFRSPVLSRLQPLDENGRALPIKPIGFYDTAYPLQDGGTAWGTNYKSSKKLTVADANRITQTLTLADMRWMRDHVLAALFTNVSWTHADPDHGNLTIYGLANGDTTQYFIQTGAEFGATDTHYLFQAAAISDAADPIPTIVAEIEEHPENTGDVIIMVPTNLKASVEGLTAFIEASDPNLRQGDSITQLTGRLGVAVPGEVIGYHSAGAWIVHWKNLTSSYIVAVMTGGERPLRQREETVDSLKGFNKVGERNDHPFYESQYLRTAGFGGWNRVGAVVLLQGAGAYAVPTGYSSPMP